MSSGLQTTTFYAGKIVNLDADSGVFEPAGAYDLPEFGGVDNSGFFGASGYDLPPGFAGFTHDDDSLF